MQRFDITRLADGVASGDRRSLAQAITLVESRHPEHRRQAAALLDHLMAGTGNAARVAITGAPGAGKSTLIESLGTMLVGDGLRVAVLAIDPSSPVTGGSILGDKTRMVELARLPQAFVRPSPAGGALGGVARRTRETMLVCEAAGFDLVIVETVGVGQSEAVVSDLVDTMVLLVAPGGGDELQGVKRGIMELSDIVVVTKDDSDLRDAVQRSAADLRTALRLVRRRSSAWTPPVLTASAATGSGLREVWQAIVDHRRALRESGDLDRFRAEQAVAWFREELTAQLLERVTSRFGRDVIDAHEQDVRSSRLSPTGAASALVDRLDQRK